MNIVMKTNEQGRQVMNIVMKTNEKAEANNEYSNEN